MSMEDQMPTAGNGESISSDSGSTRPPTVIDRYFTQRYKLNVKGNVSEDHCILSHSNRICIVTLAPSHPVVAQKKTVKSVDFKVNETTDRSQNKVSGKSKRGAQILKPNSPLCFINCEDGSTFTVYSCIRGNLVEVNEHLQTKPQLLVEKFDTEGYIAIILPRLHEYEKEMRSLVSKEDYKLKIDERSKPEESIRHEPDSKPEANSEPEANSKPEQNASESEQNASTSEMDTWNC